MRYYFLLISLLIAVSTRGQETGTYQADSVYQSNKVKVRKSLLGTNKKEGTTMYYDMEGRLTKFEIALRIGSSRRATHYIYDESGRLISMVDSTKNSKPDKKELKRLKKRGRYLSLIKYYRNRPEVVVSKYDLEYDGEQLVKKIKYNPHGTLDIVDVFEQGGKIQKRNWYKNGSVYRQSTTEFLTKFHKEKYYGWELGKNGSKRTWEYTFKYKFDQQGNVLSYTRFEGEEEKETVTYSYDARGLLTATTGLFPEFFEYEFYE